MKTTFLLGAILLFASTGHAQTPARPGPPYIQMSPPPAPPQLRVRVHRFDCDFCDNDWDSDDRLPLQPPVFQVSGPTSYSSGSPAALPAPVQQTQIRVVSSDNNDPYYFLGSALVKRFLSYREVEPFSLGEIARQVREGKATAEKSKIVARQDNDGHIRLAPEKQKSEPKP